MNTILPFSFLSGREVLGTSCENWTLDDISEAHQPRSFRAQVKFDSPFQTAPLVHLGIVGFDIGNADAARVAAVAENVTSAGFEILVSTWLHSRLWRVDINWLALGS